MAEEQKQELKYFVRIANTDLDGNKPIQNALTKIKGISFMLSNAILNSARVEKTKKAKKKIYNSEPPVAEGKDSCREGNIEAVRIEKKIRGLENGLDA